MLSVAFHHVVHEADRPLAMSAAVRRATSASSAA